MSVQEAPLEPGEHGALAPAGPGWFVLNAADARWLDGPFGHWTPFEGPASRFEELGVNLAVLQPGQPACFYHREAAQENFLVLTGEALLLIEGQERPLKAWDLVHCPPWTEHVIVGAGEGPCTLLAVGGRGRGGVVYPAAPVARHRGAAVAQETDSPREAYAAVAPDHPAAFDRSWLPGTGRPEPA